MPPAFTTGTGGTTSRASEMAVAPGTYSASATASLTNGLTLACVSPTVRERISEQESELVGRERERAILGDLITGTAPLVIFVHGVAGVGKSALVGLFAAQ